MHDLVRDCMVKRADAVGGRLRAMQRAAVPLLLTAFDESGPAAGYVLSNLLWHVRQAQLQGLAVHRDAILMPVLRHENADIHQQGVFGLGADQLRRAAEACDAEGEHLTAAFLMYAVGSTRGLAAGADLSAYSRAWASLRRLEEVGGGTASSRALEQQVASVLIIHKRGGAERLAVIERARQLASSVSGAGQLDERSKKVMEAELGLAIVASMGACTVEGFVGYPGPLTHETLAQASACWREASAHATRAAAAAPTPPMEICMRSYQVLYLFFAPRQHALPDFRAADLLGRAAAWSAETIASYRFDEVHPVAKQLGTRGDMFLHGMHPSLLLLRRGDLSAARSGFSKVLDTHRRILDRVRQGVATAEVYALTAIFCAGYLPYALVCAGQLDELREFLAHSLTGALPFDESIRVGVATYWGEGGLGAWVSEDGHRSNTLDTLLLFVRGLTALVEEDDDASRAALAEWLPPAARLLQIAEYECKWRLDASGSCHPALLLARLHGERLSHWALAAEVAEGVLRIEEFNPILRTEACHMTHTTDTPFRARASLMWRG